MTAADSMTRVSAWLRSQLSLTALRAAPAWFLASPAFYASFAHTEQIVAKALEASDHAFKKLRQALDSGCVADSLEGPIAHTGLRSNKPQQHTEET